MSQEQRCSKTHKVTNILFKIRKNDYKQWSLKISEFNQINTEGYKINKNYIY